MVRDIKWVRGLLHEALSAVPVREVRRLFVLKVVTIFCDFQQDMTYQVIFWIISRVPLDIKTISRAWNSQISGHGIFSKLERLTPCPITVRLLLSITPGRTLNPEGGLLSVSKTPSEHSSQFPTGALIAFCTSVRLK